MPAPEGETMRLAESNEGCPARQGSLALPVAFLSRLVLSGCRFEAFGPRCFGVVGR